MAAVAVEHTQQQQQQQLIKLQPCCGSPVEKRIKALLPQAPLTHSSGRRRVTTPPRSGRSMNAGQERRLGTYFLMKAVCHLPSLDSATRPGVHGSSSSSSCDAPARPAVRTLLLLLWSATRDERRGTTTTTAATRPRSRTRRVETPVSWPPWRTRDRSLQATFLFCSPRRFFLLSSHPDRRAPPRPRVG